MHILLPALPWKVTENWLTSLQFTAGVYIEWKNHASLGSWIFPRGWSHKCSKCDENRPLEERMMTDCVKGVHTPDMREPLNSATQLSQWESAAATWVPTHTTLYPWPLTSKRMPFLLATSQDFGAMQRLVLLILKHLLFVLRSCILLITPSSQLITHIFPTDDSPITVTSLSPLQLIHHHPDIHPYPDPHLPLFSSSIN